MKKIFSRRSHFLVLFVLALTVLSCDRNDDDVVQDTTDPVITITSPTQAEFTEGFTTGSVIDILGNVTDNDVVDRVNIKLADAAGTTYVDETIEDINEQSVEVDLSTPIPTFTPEGNYTLTITATDRTGNESIFTNTFAIRAP